VIRSFRFEGGSPSSDGSPGLPDRVGDGVFTWVEVVDPSPEELDRVAEAFGLHPLTIEDMGHRRQRPKIEAFDDYVFVAARVLKFSATGDLREDEIHVVAGPGYLLTFADGATPDELAGARGRCGRQAAQVEGDGSAFALYAVLDHIADGYLTVVDRLEDRADELEEHVFDRDGQEPGSFQREVFRIKRIAVQLRRASVPLRAGLDLIRDDARLSDPALAPYLRDVEEHLLRVSEMADAVRDVLTSLLEVRIGQTANDLNEVMKKLSAWAGIILVPTLIAGIYGMNFDLMPELEWGMGYPLALGSMAVSAGLLYRGFKRKGWL
jgi:magnesium transporter